MALSEDGVYHQLATESLGKIVTETIKWQGSQVLSSKRRSMIKILYQPDPKRIRIWTYGASKSFSSW